MLWMEMWRDYMLSVFGKWIWQKVEVFNFDYTRKQRSRGEALSLSYVQWTIVGVSSFNAQ